MLLVVSISSCKIPETDVERCIVDLEHELCICHGYEITAHRVGRNSKNYDRPFEYCHKLVGFTAPNWFLLREYLGNVQAYFDNEN